MSSRHLFVTALVAASVTAEFTAQSYPPGYVDPAPLLAAVAEEIGEVLRGSGYGNLLI